MADPQIPLTHSHTHCNTAPALYVTLIVITYFNQNHRFIQQISAWAVLMPLQKQAGHFAAASGKQSKVWSVWQFQISAPTLWSTVCSKLFRYWHLLFIFEAKFWYFILLSIEIALNKKTKQSKNRSYSVPRPLFEADNGKQNFWQSQTMQSAVHWAIFFFKIEKWISSI